MAKSCKGLAEELVKCLSESDCVKVFYFRKFASRWVWVFGSCFFESRKDWFISTTSKLFFWSGGDVILTFPLLFDVRNYRNHFAAESNVWQKCDLLLVSRFIKEVWWQLCKYLLLEIATQFLPLILWDLVKERELEVKRTPDDGLKLSFCFHWLLEKS